MAWPFLNAGAPTYLSRLILIRQLVACSCKCNECIHDCVGRRAVPIESSTGLSLFLQFATNFKQDPKTNSEMVESFRKFYYKMLLTLTLMGDG